MNKIGETGYRGVSKQYDKFTARITIDKEMFIIGRYNTAIEAAKAYDSFAKNVYLNRVNFKEEQK